MEDSADMTSALIFVPPKGPFVLDFGHHTVLGIQNFELQANLLVQGAVLSVICLDWSKVTNL